MIDEVTLPIASILALIQALLVPLLVQLWRTIARLGDEIVRLDKQITKIDAQAETRGHQRHEDKEDMREIFAQLRHAIEKLTERLDAMGAPPR